ncbi:hypothetical protein CTE07_18680 [Chitinophaga terrae (ex Kim and Jung 2007)]|nr:hypothetical protein CTE07_18680 [Chitinophaga terrae (ex Kim and Jung 2007)]
MTSVWKKCQFISRKGAKFPAKEQRSKAAKTFFEIIKDNKEKIVLYNAIQYYIMLYNVI